MLTTVVLLLIVIAIGTDFYVKPLMKNLLYSVPNEPKYIHSYMPYVGFGLKML